MSDSRPAPGPDGPRLGIISAPGLPATLAPALVADLGPELSRLFPAVRWAVAHVVDPLVTAPADNTEIVTAARRRLLGEDWDLTIFLTDLPLQLAHRPVTAHASVIHGVGVVCVPALGAVGVRRRLLQTVARLLQGLLSESEDGADDQLGRSQRLDRRAGQLGRATQGGPDQTELRFTARVLTGNLRLLLGMIRANRPWRLAAGLSRALTAALAAGVFALVTPDIWQLSATYGGARLLTIGVAAVSATSATLILGAHLWERPLRPQVRKQVALFNLATTATVLIGVLSFYAALLLLAAAAAAILVPLDLLAQSLGHPVRVTDYAALVWLTSSLATAGGALGAGLETDDAVREAAYSYRPSSSVD